MWHMIVTIGLCYLITNCNAANAICHNCMLYQYLSGIHPCLSHQYLHMSIYPSVNPWWCHQMETFSALLALCVGIHRSPLNSPDKDQWSGALMFSLMCAWTNGWVNDCDIDDLRCHCTHYDITVMLSIYSSLDIILTILLWLLLYLGDPLPSYYPYHQS